MKLFLRMKRCGWQRSSKYTTLKHASWLNMVEIELSVLSRQCLSGYSTSKDEMVHKIAAWQSRRNAACHSVDWRFTTDNARIKLKRLYPVMSDF